MGWVSAAYSVFRASVWFLLALRWRWANQVGNDDQTDEIRGILARKNTTARAALLGALNGLDVEGQLRAGGLEDGDLATLRSRLVR